MWLLNQDYLCIYPPHYFLSEKQCYAKYREKPNALKKKKVGEKMEKKEIQLNF